MYRFKYQIHQNIWHGSEPPPPFLAMPRFRKRLLFLIAPSVSFDYSWNAARCNALRWTGGHTGDACHDQIRANYLIVTISNHWDSLLYLGWSPLEFSNQQGQILPAIFFGKQHWEKSLLLFHDVGVLFQPLFLNHFTHIFEYFRRTAVIKNYYYTLGKVHIMLKRW